MQGSNLQNPFIVLILTVPVKPNTPEPGAYRCFGICAKIIADIVAIFRVLLRLVAGVLKYFRTWFGDTDIVGDDDGLKSVANI